MEGAFIMLTNYHVLRMYCIAYVPMISSGLAFLLTLCLPVPVGLFVQLPFPFGSPASDPADEQPLRGLPREEDEFLLHRS